jgi:hypothetical protein
VKDVRVPGFLWVILLLLVGAAIQFYAPQIEVRTGLSPAIVEMIVALCFGAYKYFNLGTDQLNTALDIIGFLRQRLDVARDPQQQMRGPQSSLLLVPEIHEEDIPERPNKAARWLLG